MVIYSTLDKGYSRKIEIESKYRETQRRTELISDRELYLCILWDQHAQRSNISGKRFNNQSVVLKNHTTSLDKPFQR